MKKFTEIVTAAACEMQRMAGYWTTFPKIAAEAELCAFHRKRNKSVPSCLLAITTVLMAIQVIRITLTLFGIQSFSLKQVVPVWLAIDMCCLSGVFYGLYLKQLVSSPEYKDNCSFMPSYSDHRRHLDFSQAHQKSWLCIKPYLARFIPSRSFHHPHFSRWHSLEIIRSYSL